MGQNGVSLNEERIVTGPAGDCKDATESRKDDSRQAILT